MECLDGVIQFCGVFIFASFIVCFFFDLLLCMLVVTGFFFQSLGIIYEGSRGLYTRRNLRKYWRGRYLIFTRHETSTFIFLSCSDVSVPGDDSCRVLDGLKSPNNDPCSLKYKSVSQKGEAEILKVGWFPKAMIEAQH